MAATSESIIAKTAKLVRASRTNFITDATIDWRTDFTASADATSQTNFLRQAPLQIPPMYSGNRFVVFTLLKHPGFVVPQNVTVRACQGELTVSVPVDLLPADESRTHLIHTLAARKIIQDLDDNDRDIDSSATKSTIIHLGEQYQLASRYTSFIAIDDNGVAQQGIYAPSPTSSTANFSGGGRYLSTSAPRSAGRGKSSGNKNKRVVLMPEANASSVQSLRRSLSAVGRSASKGAEPSEPATLWSKVKSGPRPVVFSETRFMSALPPPPGSGRLASMSGGSSASGSSPTLSAPITPAPGRPPPESVGGDKAAVRLIRLQAFDGSFPATAEFEQIVGASALAEASKMGVGKAIWATMLAIAFLKKHMTDQPDVLECLIDKAMDFVSESGVDYKALLDAAAVLIV